MSLSFTLWSLRNERLRLRVLCSRLWLRNGCRCMSLPVAVSLNRFFAALLLFILGMSGPFPGVSIVRCRCDGPAGRYALLLRVGRGSRLRLGLRSFLGVGAIAGLCLGRRLDRAIA